jgi:hypothetical protein
MVTKSSSSHIMKLALDLVHCRVECTPYGLNKVSTWLQCETVQLEIYFAAYCASCIQCSKRVYTSIQLPTTYMEYADLGSTPSYSVVGHILSSIPEIVWIMPACSGAGAGRQRVLVDCAG